MTEPSLRDYSLVRTKTEKKKKDYNFPSLSSAFYFVVIDLILGLQDDEIKDSITDTNFLKESKQTGGHDRGIDALYIDETAVPPVIHLFNFKYAETFENSKKNFPSKDINDILNFISSLNKKDEILLQGTNFILVSKVQDIWKIFESQNPKFIFHFCSNYYKNIEQLEKERFERSVGRDYDIQYHLMPDLVRYIVSDKKQIVNGKITAISDSYFIKANGDISALIVNVAARDLVRVVLNDEAIRSRTNMSDDEYELMKCYEILEDAFDDNVRTYLKKSPINKNIKATALSEDSDKFFYYNNGVTLTCDSFSYSSRQSPIIELVNIQVVNGSQTIHSLYEAFLEDSNKFRDDLNKFRRIEILCRICEVKHPDLSTRIAEYTNSQNPVKSRDIRSVDFIQLSLEKEFLVHSIFYERKKDQYADKPVSQRIDAEKAGQVLMAFFNGSPYEAKNKKRLIFGDKYEEVFNETVNADKVLLAYSLFEKIESEKNRVKSEIINDKTLFDSKSYILHASYFILYIMGELAKRKNITLDYANLQKIWDLYQDVVNIIERTIAKEKRAIGQKYTHSTFFRSNKSKKYFEELEEVELIELLGLSNVKD